jgi:hypothetical protein
MKRVVLGTVLVAAISVFTPDARADGATWTMTYTGSCFEGGTCFNVHNWSSGPGVQGSSVDGDGVKGLSSSSYGVNAQGVVGVKGVGVYGVEASGVTAPIWLGGTIPSNGGSTLCKSTSGSTAGHIGICSSTRAMKQGIHDLELGVETLMQLRPVTFHWKSNHSADIGFIAEEVARVNPILAVYSEEGKLESVKYTQLTALLTKALQDQVRERNSIEEDLRKQLSALDRRNAELTTQLRDQQALISNLASRLSAVEQRAHALK